MPSKGRVAQVQSHRNSGASALTTAFSRIYHIHDNTVTVWLSAWELPSGCRQSLQLCVSISLQTSLEHASAHFFQTVSAMPCRIASRSESGYLHAQAREQGVHVNSCDVLPACVRRQH